MKFASLLKAEAERVWSRPVLELTLVLVFLLSMSAIQPLISIIPPDRLETEVFSIAADSITLYAETLTLFLSIICAILAALSFAKDYEQGLLQTLLSLPLSRSLIFASKLIAITAPITLLAWATMALSLYLNFYFLPNALIKAILPALPIFFVISLLSYSIATLISLATKRILPSILASSAMVLVLFFVSNPPVGTYGTFGYIPYTPLKAPVMTLMRVFGESYSSIVIEDLPSTWLLLTLSLTYVFVPLIVSYLFFTRKLEVKQ